jgi:hypothetical protein
LEDGGSQSDSLCKIQTLDDEVWQGEVDRRAGKDVCISEGIAVPVVVLS